VSEDDELDSVSSAQLGEDPRDVGLDRSFSAPEALTDLGVGAPVSDLEEDLELPRGELGRPADSCGRRRPSAGKTGADQQTGDLWTEQFLASRNSAGGLAWPVRGGGLEQETGGSRSQSRVHVVLEPERGKDQDAAVGPEESRAPVAALAVVAPIPPTAARSPPGAGSTVTVIGT
jgi:hypothetical protein